MKKLLAAMKKLLAAALAGGLALGIAGVASAAPDPTGPAKHGLCTAYFNGSPLALSDARMERISSAFDSSTSVVK